ncbi:YqjF family protein [Flavivirga algicola]|uniref:DUF2071 domain-containing protein n=1 Tax=Flavivirga algicola TaxID=2729136 RepID=A0ABX1S2T5_9FLAO|nr:DUF2071 domain-containing protein [Flavivirga algicola]NMH88855.1 DUF2071 domain-containing protein [Flavivirga algicola]
MHARDILKHEKHRSFKYPNRKWTYYQEWNKAIFLHWEVNPELIEPYLPKGIKLDIINGKTWLSLVAFDMNNIGIKNVPKIPYISDFQEINIRVYVIYNNKPSVYFLSMEGSKKASCVLLKMLSKFPYRFSRMNRNETDYSSQNSVFNDCFHVSYKLDNKPVQKDEIDLWLTERYAVFQDYKRHIIEYDVHHIEWPMQNIVTNKLEINYPRFKHLINNRPHKIHFSSGVQVLTWNKVKHPI